MTLIGDVQKLNSNVESLQKQVDQNSQTVARHEEQISGERGLSNAINVLSEEVKSLRRALYTAGGGFVAAAIGFGFAAMKLTGAG